MIGKGKSRLKTVAQQWIEEGRQQGMQQGLRQAMRQNVVELLEERFPAQGRRSATGESLAEFEQALDTVTTPPH